jgi:plastocyanin
MTGMMRFMKNSEHTGRRRVIALVAVGMLVLGLSACGGDDDDSTASNSTSGTTAAATDTTASGGSDTTAGGSDTTAGSSDTTAASTDKPVAVTIKQFAFSSKPVKAGQEFSIKNEDSVNHTFTSDDSSFQGVAMNGGDTGSTVAPSTPGTYKFHCEIHKSMTGTLTVE